MKTKKKQPKKAQSQLRKLPDLQTKKNPKGGTLLFSSGICYSTQTPTAGGTASAQGG